MEDQHRSHHHRKGKSEQLKLESAPSFFSYGNGRLSVFRVDVKADRIKMYMLVEIVGLIWVNVSARQTQSLRRQRLIGFFLTGFTSFDNVTFCEEDFLQLCPPNWFAAKQEFQVHSEVLEFFLLRAFHDRLRFFVCFN